MRNAIPQLLQGKKAPQAPTPPPPPDIPRTPTELEALVAKRGELQHQLESITDRREEISDQLTEAVGSARPGLEARIQMLDERSARIEREILQADEAIADALASGVQGPARPEVITMTHPPDENFVSKEVLANAMLAEAVAFVLVGFLLVRSLMKRARQRFSGAGPEDSKRLDQLQNSVDAIAVEIERISEGQRYVSKALNEGVQPAVGAQGREEVLVPRKGT